MQTPKKLNWSIFCGVLILGILFWWLWSIKSSQSNGSEQGSVSQVRRIENGEKTRDDEEGKQISRNSSLRDVVDATERLEKLEANLERQQKLNGWDDRGVDYNEAMTRNLQKLYSHAGVDILELDNLPEDETKSWMASNQKLKTAIIGWLKKLEKVSVAWDAIQNYPGNKDGVVSPVFSRPVDLSDSSFSPNHYLGGRIKFASAEEYENFAGLEWYLGGMVASGPFPELVAWMTGRKDVVPSKTVDIVVISVFESALSFDHVVAGSDVSRLASELADAKNPDYRMIGQLAEKRSQAH